MDLDKLGASQILPVLKHDLRDLPDGRASGNESIDPQKTAGNYSLLNRGKTVKEINKYRKDLEKEIFQYNRKDLVHAIQIVIQLPRDCPPEQEKDFFQACHDFYCSWFPMGEPALVSSTVHVDEIFKDSAGKIVLDSEGKTLSKHHLHIIGIPAVPDNKHSGYDWKLCADQLTKRNRLKMLHPDLQKFLDERGIKATVYNRQTSGGKTVKLSVKQLKEITQKTGLTLDKSITVEKLCEILKENHDIKILDSKLAKALEQSKLERKNLSSGLEKISTSEAVLKQQVQELQEENAQLKKTIKLQQEKLAAVEKEREQQEIQQSQNGWNKSSGWNRQQSYGTERTW